MLIDFVFIKRCISKCLNMPPHKLGTICNCQCLTIELSHTMINGLIIRNTTCPEAIQGYSAFLKAMSINF